MGGEVVTELILEPSSYSDIILKYRFSWFSWFVKWTIKISSFLIRDILFKQRNTANLRNRGKYEALAMAMSR